MEVMMADIENTRARLVEDFSAVLAEAEDMLKRGATETGEKPRHIARHRPPLPRCGYARRDSLHRRLFLGHVPAHGLWPDHDRLLRGRRARLVAVQRAATRRSEAVCGDARRARARREVARGQDGA